MPYIRETAKSVEQAVVDFEASVQRNGFGVLHTYDLKATLSVKGFELASECRVLEICNPKLASEILHNDMSVNMALPCRVSIYEDEGKTKIGMIPPTDLLGLISQSDSLQKAAHDVEQTVAAIIDESI